MGEGSITVATWALERLTMDKGIGWVDRVPICPSLECFLILFVCYFNLDVMVFMGKLQKKQGFPKNPSAWEVEGKRKEGSTALKQRSFQSILGRYGGDSCTEWSSCDMVRAEAGRWWEERGQWDAVIETGREEGRDHEAWSPLYEQGKFRLGLLCHLWWFVVVVWVFTQGRALLILPVPRNLDSNLMDIWQQQQHSNSHRK